MADDVRTEDVTMASGFTVRVKPMPPYYKDLIDEIIPMPEYPDRQISLMSGDVVGIPYTPPEKPVEPSDADYDLYMRWMAVDARRKEIEIDRKKARSNFFIVNCVSIADGPVDINSEEWVYRVEAAFPNYKVPTHPGKRLLVFLKTQVITKPEEMELLVEKSTYPEVSMQGILNALRGFQSIVEQGTINQSDTEAAIDKVGS